MIVAILTITFGALGVTGGLQELVVQGIGNNLRVPLVGGTLGVVCSSLMVAAGIALLRDTPGAPALTRAAAWMGLAVTFLVGMTGWGLAGWPMTVLGLLWPTFLLWHVRTRRV